jgi:hypothetical protein
MAKTGLLAQSKPAANTNTVLYKAPIGQSASAVLTVANDGTGSAYSAAVKDWDQKLTLDASNYLLHPGDVITAYRIEVDTNMTANSGFTSGVAITTEDEEKVFQFESFYVPAFTEIFVKDVALRTVTIESVTGNFEVGQVLTTGTAPDDTEATVFAVNDTGASTILYIGPSTINGSGAEFSDGDIVATSFGGSATISTGGIAAAVQAFVFSTTTANGVYDYFLNGLEVFSDRAYRFDVSDSSMTGRDFKLSITANGEWGPDGVFGSGTPIDDGTEYTTNKTSNGTAGSSGAYLQYDLAGTGITGSLYFYDGGTGTAGNSIYGGTSRVLSTSNQYTYTGIYIYNLNGSLVTNTDTFTLNEVTYTITGETVGAYGYVRSYSGTELRVCLGAGSANFAGTNTFRDNPISQTATRNTATVSAVVAGSSDLDAESYIIIGKTNGANNIDRTTSLVLGPGQKLVVNSVTQNNVFNLVGFEDVSTSFTTRVNVADYGGVGGGGGGQGAP